jgi:LPS sulfotransferase NodH
VSVTEKAVTAIDHPLVQRVRRTKIGRELRTTRLTDHALRVLRLRYAREVSRREALWRQLAARRSTASTTSATGTPFVLLCQARTGSNLVQSELCRRWPSVRCLGEEYGPHLRQHRPGETLEEVTARVFAPTEAQPTVGCRLFYEHVSPDELEGILALPGMKVVHLQRRNALRRYVSLEIAQQTQVWARGRRHAGQSIGERAVTIDVDQFINTCFRVAERQASRERVIVDSGVDVLDVWYEDLSEHVDHHLRRIATFLGQGEPLLEALTFLVRQNPEPLRLLVRNYDEVRSALAHTPMREYLDPEDVGHRRPVVPWRNRTRTCWPTAEQELLLQAALLPPGAAGEAFARWQGAADPFVLDEGSRRLLPLVHRNLRRGRIETTLDSFLWNAYVRASGRNQVLLHTLEEAQGGRPHGAPLPRPRRPPDERPRRGGAGRPPGTRARGPPGRRVGRRGALPPRDHPAPRR